MHVGGLLCGSGELIDSLAAHCTYAEARATNGSFPGTGRGKSCGRQKLRAPTSCKRVSAFKGPRTRQRGVEAPFSSSGTLPSAALRPSTATHRHSLFNGRCVPGRTAPKFLHFWRPRRAPMLEPARRGSGPPDCQRGRDRCRACRGRPQPAFGKALQKSVRRVQSVQICGSRQQPGMRFQFIGLPSRPWAAGRCLPATGWLHLVTPTPAPAAILWPSAPQPVTAGGHTRRPSRQAAGCNAGRSPRWMSRRSGKERQFPKPVFF